MSVGTDQPGTGSSPPPEGDEYELSGWWRRVGAVLLDGLILLIPLIVLGLLTPTTTTTTNPNTGLRTSHISLLTSVLDTVVWGIYVVVLLARPGAHNGQTLGKQGAGIAVLRNDGKPMDYSTAALRDIVCKGGPSLVGSALIAAGSALGLIFLLVPLVDYLWPLWDIENRALHDHVAKTHVVRVTGSARYYRPSRS